MLKSSLALVALLGLGGCANLTSEQRTNLSLQLALAKQIGHDAVSIWCATSGVVYIVAKNVNAQSRVTNALAVNSQAATDACPMIGQITGVQVVLPTTLPMSVTKGT